MTTNMFSFIVITIWSFTHSWFITGFVTRKTWQVPHVEHKLLTFPEHLMLGVNNGIYERC